MKKVGILTIYDEDNYGNRLQNYAVQIVLENLGFDVETIRNINIVGGINYLDVAKKVDEKRRNCFLDFNSNIKVSDEVLYHDKVDKDFEKKYDYFIVGSDQIWNYNFPDRFSERCFLDFAPENKRIAYAASFGIDKIDADKLNMYKKVVEIKKISVREYAGKEILENQFNVKNAEVLIDPTMMLDEPLWKKVSKKPKDMTNKKYLLKYFLGFVSEERKEKIEQFAKENDLIIVDIFNKNSEYYYTGPGEFLYLIKNAEMVLTDSFHSCVFSLLFKKNFLYFLREGNSNNINSRLDTLFKKFDIKDRFYTGELNSNTLKRGCEEINSQLDFERKKSMEFLKKSLDLK